MSPEQDNPEKITQAAKNAFNGLAASDTCFGMEDFLKILEPVVASRSDVGGMIAFGILTPEKKGKTKMFRPIDVEKAVLAKLERQKEPKNNWREVGGSIPSLVRQGDKHFFGIKVGQEIIELMLNMTHIDK